MLAFCVQVGLIGEGVDLTYTYTHLGSDAAAISKLAPGQPFFESLKKAAHPMVIVGPGVLNRWVLGSCWEGTRKLCVHATHSATHSTNLLRQ
jgi:hypothetical protein